VNDPEQLKNIGEYLKSFLDPFGIDVAYYVSNNNKQEEQTVKTEKQDAEKTTTTTSDVKMDTNEQSSNVTTATATATTTTTTATSTTDFFPSVVTSSPVHNPFSSIMSHSVSSLSLSPFAKASEALQQVLLNQSTASAPPATEDSSESVTVEKKHDTSVESEFNMVDIEKELRIIRAIEQMKQMGYSDENGWLTRLVMSKDGNLNAVLDTLTPMGKKNK